MLQEVKVCDILKQSNSNLDIFLNIITNRNFFSTNLFWVINLYISPNTIKKLGFEWKFKSVQSFSLFLQAIQIYLTNHFYFYVTNILEVHKKWPIPKVSIIIYHNFVNFEVM